MMNILKKKKGSTLIEVLIAMAILALVVAPFLSMFLQAARANAESRVMMDASYYGQALMEEVKYSLGANGIGDARTYLNDRGYAAEEKVEDAHYIYTKTIDDFTYEVDLDTTSVASFLQITVKVYTDAAKSKCKANIQVLCQ